MVKTVLLLIYVAVSLIFLVPFGLVAFIFYVIGLRKAMKQVFYRIAQGWGLAIIKLTGCKVTVTGRENIPKKGGVCFVSNHSGYFDIILMLAYSGRMVGFVAKKEFLLVPFLNIWIYMLGGFFIDRSSLRKASQTINKGVEKIKSGHGLIIFPEGHRSLGRGLLPFHPGSFKLATMAEAPIIPTVIEGSYELLEKNKRFTKTPLKVTFCEPIDTASLPMADRKLILSDKIYAVIKEKLGK